MQGRLPAYLVAEFEAFLVHSVFGVFYQVFQRLVFWRDEARMELVKLLRRSGQVWHQDSGLGDSANLLIRRCHRHPRRGALAH